jgi:hypothetical protein
MAIKLIKKAVPHTQAGIKKALNNICFIQTFPENRKQKC